MMLLQKSADSIFIQLIDSICRLTAEQYKQPCISLNQHTVGQHVRHVVELFQCLEKGYEDNIVNYENRKRDIQIETNQEIACRLLTNISARLNRPDKELKLLVTFDPGSGDFLEISTNYYREVAYNIEHMIHHMALIRIGITDISRIVLSDQYGVAAATIKHRNQCVQ